MSHGRLTSRGQWVVKHFWVLLQSSTEASFLFHSEIIISQDVAGFVLCSQQFSLTLASPTDKRNYQYLQKKLCFHSSLLFQMLAAFLNPFVKVNSSLLDKAFGRVPQGQLCQFGFPELVHLSLSMVRGWLSQSPLILSHSFLKIVKFHLKDFMADSLHLKNFAKSNRNS